MAGDADTTSRPVRARRLSGEPAPRSRRARQEALQDQSREACIESKTLIDGATERVLSSGRACAVHHEQVAKSRDTIAQTRALIRRLDDG